MSHAELISNNHKPYNHQAAISPLARAAARLGGAAAACSAASSRHNTHRVRAVSNRWLAGTLPGTANSDNLSPLSALSRPSSPQNVARTLPGSRLSVARLKHRRRPAQRGDEAQAAADPLASRSQWAQAMSLQQRNGRPLINRQSPMPSRG